MLLTTLSRATAYVRSVFTILRCDLAEYGFDLSLRHIKGLGNSPAVVNVASSAIRTLAKSLWGLFVPFVLPITGFGAYSLLETTVIAVTQLSVLGAPQTILREPRRRLPILGLLLHAFLLASITISSLALSAQQGKYFYGLVWVATIVSVTRLILNARVKARFLFSLVLRAELIGALALGVSMLLLTVLLGTCGRGCLDYSLIIITEVLITLATLIFLLTYGKDWISPSELTLRGTSRLLPSIYSVGILVVFDIIIWKRIEVYFLEASHDGLVAVAVFNLSMQIANLFLLLISSTIEAWYPSLAYKFQEDIQEYKRILSQKRETYIKVYITFTIVGLLLSPLVVVILFHQYIPWLPYIYAFIATKLVCSYAGFYSSVLYASKKERWLYVPVICGSVIALLTNSTLTLRLGLPGAVVSYLATQFSVAISTLLAYHQATQYINPKLPCMD